MAERRSGLWSSLAKPKAHEALQTLLGADRSRERFATEDLRPSRGERVLDIGRGTARLARYRGPVSYTGFEPNADYAAQGRSECAGRDVTLHAGFFDAAAAGRLEPLTSSSSRPCCITWMTARRTSRSGFWRK